MALSLQRLLLPLWLGTAQISKHVETVLSKELNSLQPSGKSPASWLHALVSSSLLGSSQLVPQQGRSGRLPTPGCQRPPERPPPRCGTGERAGTASALREHPASPSSHGGGHVLLPPGLPSYMLPWQKAFQAGPVPGRRCAWCMSYGIASCIYLNQVFWAEMSPLGFWMFRLSGHTCNYSFGISALVENAYF